MHLSFTEKKNIRRSFGKLKESLSIPNLIEVQKNSYKQLTEFNVKSIRCIPGEKPLTKKELEVFGYLFNGLKLSKIASTLEVSLPTVKFHLKNLYRKLGIKGRREIITICQSAPK